MPGTEPLSQILGRLDHIDDTLNTLLLDVTAPPRAGNPGGLLARQAAVEGEIAHLMRLIKDLETASKDLQAAPGKSALNWSDRLAMMGLASLVSALAGTVGYHLQGGIK